MIFGVSVSTTRMGSIFCDTIFPPGESAIWASPQFLFIRPAGTKGL